jgi:SAM-dependent methyltransferase
MLVLVTEPCASALYDDEHATRYVSGAPHLAHTSLRSLFATLAREAYTRAAAFTGQPRVLDLGAGQGAAALVFLEFGAHVTVVDNSESQLRLLREQCAPYSDRLEVFLDDAMNGLERLAPSYDVIVASSFLHHLPDYLGFVRRAASLASPHGVFLSFQDPLRYDRLPRSTLLFSRLAYAAWRFRQQDVIGGLQRRARRARGVYLETCAEDWIEYHATRGGVDADAVIAVLKDEGLRPRVVYYFSTQSGLFQWLGERLGLETTFAILAPRLAPSD